MPSRDYAIFCSSSVAKLDNKAYVSHCEIMYCCYQHAHRINCSLPFVVHFHKQHAQHYVVKLMWVQERALSQRQWRYKGRSNWWCPSCIIRLCNASPTILWSSKTWLVSPTILMLVCRSVCHSSLGCVYFILLCIYPALRTS